jgi:hypothetical protein
MMDYRPQIKPYWAYAPEEHRCPTECDLWCPYKCHEAHIPGHQRDHLPQDCPAWAAFKRDEKAQWW